MSKLWTLVLYKFGSSQSENTLDVVPGCCPEESLGCTACLSIRKIYNYEFVKAILFIWLLLLLLFIWWGIFTLLCKCGLNAENMFSTEIKNMLKTTVMFICLKCSPWNHYKLYNFLFRRSSLMFAARQTHTKQISQEQQWPRISTLQAPETLHRYKCKSICNQ